MKIISIAIVVLGLLLINFNSMTKTRVKISSKSEVSICGKSNINSFQCKYNSNFLEEEIVVTSIKSTDNIIYLNNAKIAIKSKGFDCSHEMITKDLKTTLKANSYENIYIQLKEIEFESSELIARIEVEMAGKTKDYLVPMIFIENNNNVKGTLKLNIKDFNLKSPKKMFGLIEVQDNVDINFNLFLQY